MQRARVNATKAFKQKQTKHHRHHNQSQSSYILCKVSISILK